MDKDIILTAQYKVYNERRLHFGRMFFQNIALHIIGIIAIFAFRELSLGKLSLVLLYCVGPASILIAFIAGRLRKLEAVYEHHLRNIEDQWIAEGIEGVQRAPVSGKFGARNLVVIILALGGMLFTLLSLASLPSL